MPRDEADVVIVGYGGAGAVAAITAQDSGADVLVLEKSSQGGGNTRRPKKPPCLRQVLRSMKSSSRAGFLPISPWEYKKWRNLFNAGEF
jgi:choline dehydrogenase-like flavoprotein